MSNYYEDSIKKSIPLIRWGIVTNNIDNGQSGIIQVRIDGIDDTVKIDSELPPCLPLLPRFLNVLPKVGEAVYVFQWDYDTGAPNAEFQNTRLYFGPVISTPTKLDYDDAKQSNSVLPFGHSQVGNPNIQEGAYGISDNDIVLQGRYNTDIIQKDRQVWLRVGKFVEGENNQFNTTDIGYIQLRYGGEKLKTTTEDKEIVTKVAPIPNRLIQTYITTYITGNIALANDLSPERYVQSDITKTTINITVKDLESNNILNTLVQDFIGVTSRESAILSSNTFINTWKGNKWKLKCDAPDLLNNYPNASNGIAIYSITPKEERKIIKVNKTTIEKDDKSSVINLVANKINLLSHDGEHTFDLTDPKQLITGEEQEVINSEAHPLVYGDKLVEFLNLMKEYVNLHVHPYNGLPADPDSTKLEVLRFDLDTILNKNINSN